MSKILHSTNEGVNKVIGGNLIQIMVGQACQVIYTAVMSIWNTNYHLLGSFSTGQKLFVSLLNKNLKIILHPKNCKTAQTIYSCRNINPRSALKENGTVSSAFYRFQIILLLCRSQRVQTISPSPRQNISKFLLLLLVNQKNWGE